MKKAKFILKNVVTKSLIILISIGIFSISLNAQDVPRNGKSSRVGATQAFEPTVSDELFVGTTGANYDSYLLRKEVANGRLKLPVNITRFYSSAMKFDGQGFLTNASELIKNGLIPATARLTMRVYDIDHDSQFDGNGDGIADPEVDYVFLNGKLLLSSDGTPRKLGSGNNTWSTPSINVPIEFIKFPMKQGSTTTSPKAENIIEIEVDVPNTTYWAVECDWVSIEIQNKIRPLVLVRGFGASSGGSSALNAMDTWKEFGEFLQKDGIPHHIAETIEKCGSIATNAQKIDDEVNLAKKIFGVDKVNLIGHSKGGLDARAYLRISNNAQNLVQMGTPNHGTGFASEILFCNPAGINLKPEWLAENFNFQNSNQNQPLYASETKIPIYQIISNDDFYVSNESATLPWKAIYANGNVQTPINTVSDGVASASHTELRKNRQAYQLAIRFINSNVRTSSSRINAEKSVLKTNTVQDSLKIVFLENQQVLANSNKLLNAYLPISGIAIFQGVFQNEISEFSLKSPSGKIYDKSSIEYGKDEAIIRYKIINAEKGNWVITLKGGKENTFYGIKVLSKSNKNIIIKTDKSKYLTNESIILNTTFTDKELPIVNGKSIVYTSEKIKIDSVELFDDGTHNDVKINDGIYGNKIAGFKSIGFYSVIVKAKFQDESIYDEHLITVSDNTAEFTNTFKEQVLDKNADKLYDSLQIKVGFKVKTTGNFTVSGSLKDSKGSLIGTASWSNSKTKPLAVGTTYDAVLNFNGERISKNGVNGPYIVDDLILMDLTNSTVVDSRKKAYTTKFYDALFFSRTPIELTGKNSETPIDSDKDGDFDFLDIKIQANVTQAGTYSLSAELIDSLQNSLNWAQNSISLKAGLNDITLRFAGSGINEKLANGPYTLTNLYFNGSVVSVTFYDVYKTNKYKFSDFTGNIITGTLKDKFSNALVPDATIILKGTKLVTVKTDNKGVFTIAGLPNGAYTLEAQKLNFCSSPISTIASLKSNTTIDLLVINKKISINSQKTQQICKGDSVILNLPSGWTNYTWANGTTNPKIVVKTNGIFSATVSNQTCQAITDTITITVIDPPKPTISTDGVVNFTSSVSESYQWLLNGQIISGATAQSYTANASGKYSVKGSLKGCFNTSDEFTLIITAIEEEPNSSEIQVEVSPNPTQEVCNVKIDLFKPSKVSLQLRDISGKSLQEQNLSNANKHHETTLEFNNYPSGVYLLQVNVNDKSVVKKVIKQ